jgi:hypothetical protein
MERSVLQPFRGRFLMRNRFVFLILVLGLAVGGCGSAEDASTSPEPTTTSTTVATTTTTVAPTSPTSEVPVGLTSVVVAENAEFRGMLIPDDDLPILLVEGPCELSSSESGICLRVIKCLDEGCTESVSDAELPLRSLNFYVHDVTADPDGFPAFVYTDSPGDEEDMELFERDLPPNVRVHLVRCADATCAEYTDTDLGRGGGLPSLVILSDDRPVVTFWSIGESRADTSDWGIPTIVTCDDRACVERETSQVDSLQEAVVEAMTSGDDELLLAYSRRVPGEALYELGIASCEDVECSRWNLTLAVVTEEELFTSVVATGSEGPLFAHVTSQIHFVRCLDGGCQETGPTSLIGQPLPYLSGLALAEGDDGRPLLALGNDETGEVVLAVCDDDDCSEGSFIRIASEWVFELEVAADNGGIPVVAYGTYATSSNVVLARCADPECTLGTQMSGTWDQASSVQTVEPVGPLMEGWNRAETPKQTGWLVEVIEGGPGLLAFGGVCTPKGLDCEVVVWGSEDGKVWTELASLGPGEFRTVSRLGSVIAVGGSRCAGDVCGPALWTSTDGESWNLASTDRDEFPVCAESDECVGFVDGIAQLPSGGAWAFGWSSQGPSAWISTDGRDWVLQEDPPAPFGTSAGDGWSIDQVFSGGDGVVATGMVCQQSAFVAVAEGFSASAETICDVLLATSADGVTWRQLDPPIDADGDTWVETGVSEWSGGYVAVAESCAQGTDDCQAYLLTSTDGVEWNRRSLERDLEGIWVQGIYGFQDGVIAIGETAGEGTLVAQRALMVSPDGINWAIYSVDPEAFPWTELGINDMVDFGDIAVGVGATRDGSAIWWYQKQE